jgi:DNA replication protein DnaC
MLPGNCGVGKTWMMELFQRNQRQVYHLVNAKFIADNYEQNGEDKPNYEDKVKNAYNDANVFFQPYAGLCIDDIGTEDIKNFYGNRKNVIGDLIEKRYAKGNTGVFLHATTNLTADQLSEFYGSRVGSRMREIFNFIELPGGDRRT